MYSFRHYFASHALWKGIPIYDMAEWVVLHYRPCFPGSTKAARMLDAGPGEAA
ncbi:hypothetical protein [Streptomyces sp. NPDC014006]|uniref:hypothetical protein n=1 Tax=Streptomyces sp. NPDC014006 TaxID=3364870 RepID=UPI0036F70CDF